MAALTPFAILAPQVSLEADPRELDAFVQALFRYADAGAFVSRRAFRDDRKDAPPVFIESSHVVEDGLDRLVEAATYWATKAAQHPDPVVFCPPIATFTSAKKAGAVTWPAPTIGDASAGVARARARAEEGDARS